MKKRIVSFMLALCMVVGIMPAYTAEAATSTYYSEYGIWFDASTGTITGSSGVPKNLVIPEEIDGVTVTSIGLGAFDERLALESIVIPDSVTSIGNSAFWKCENLTSVIMSDNVRSIGDNAFEWCYSLESIELPYGITRIGNDVFYECYSLESIIIPDSVTSIGDGAFAMSGLTNVTIPSNVTSIGEFAFSGCLLLEGIAIPNSVMSIGDAAFACCCKLKRIDVSNNNPSYMDIDGVLFTKNGKALLGYPAGKATESYEIPHSVTVIKKCAFEGAEKLINIIIPDGIKNIEDTAFSSCISLTSVAIPDSVTSVGKMAFMWCSSLESAEIPDSVTNIDDYTFYACNLERVEIPDSITNIGSYAFYACNLKNIVMFDSVISVGDGAFEGCSSLSDVYYIGSKEQWKKISVGADNERLTKANIHFDPNNYSLFRHYPEYLNNAAFFEVINSCSDTVGYTIDNIPSGKFKWGKYLHYQANMGKILWDSFAEIVAMSCAEDYTNAVERAQDEQLLELLRGLESSSSAIKGIVAEVGDAFRENMEYVTGVGDAYDFAYTTSTAQFASDLSQATKGKYSTEDIKKITGVVTGKWGKISKLLGNIGDKIKPAEVITTLVMTDMVNGELIDLLWEKSGQGTDLRAALDRIIDRRTVLGNAQYFIETYLVEEALAKLGEYAPGLISKAISYISEASVTATTLSLAYTIAKGVVDISVWVVQQYPGTLVIDDYNAAVINWDNNATFRKILADDRMRFLDYKISSSAPSTAEFNREIEEYEIIYCGLMMSMRTALQNARKLTTKDSTQERIDAHLKLLDAWTYDYYIQSCKNNVINAQADKFKYEVIDNKVKITGLPDVMTASEEDYSMLVIPDEIDGLPVTAIAEGAFAGYSTFNAVIIPDSVTDMGAGAFEGCTQLNAAIIGNGITEIGDNSFKGCTALKAAELSENTKTVGESAFANCSSLSEVIIPENVETVKTNAFSGNSALTEVTVLGKNSQLSETAFEGSSGVTVKAYSDSAAQTFAAEQNISFEELDPTVTNLEITKLPDKLRFEKGEAVDASGMELKATYNDGSAETVTEGWILSCDIATPGKQTVTVFYGDGTATYDVVINAGWTTETDAGYYNENGEKCGIMRYLFHADIAGEVMESGVKFIKSETDDTQVGEIIKGEPSKAFYGDIINIPENTVGKYFAKGFVVVDGIIYWSDPLGCIPDFTIEFKK